MGFGGEQKKLGYGGAAAQAGNNGQTGMSFDDKIKKAAAANAKLQAQLAAKAEQVKKDKEAGITPAQRLEMDLKECKDQFSSKKKNSNILKWGLLLTIALAAVLVVVGLVTDNWISCNLADDALFSEGLSSRCIADSCNDFQKGPRMLKVVDTTSKCSADGELSQDLNADPYCTEYYQCQKDEKIKFKCVNGFQFDGSACVDPKQAGTPSGCRSFLCQGNSGTVYKDHEEWYVGKGNTGFYKCEGETYVEGGVCKLGSKVITTNGVKTCSAPTRRLGGFYEIGTKNDLNCAGDNRRIVTEQMCQEAASQLGKGYNGKKKTAIYVFGCYIINDKVYFNAEFQGNVNHTDVAPVCQVWDTTYHNCFPEAGQSTPFFCKEKLGQKLSVEAEYEIQKKCSEDSTCTGYELNLKGKFGYLCKQGVYGDAAAKTESDQTTSYYLKKRSDHCERNDWQAHTVVTGEIGKPVVLYPQDCDGDTATASDVFKSDAGWNCYESEMCRWPETIHYYPSGTGLDFHNDLYISRHEPSQVIAFGGVDYGEWNRTGYAHMNVSSTFDTFRTQCITDCESNSKCKSVEIAHKNLVWLTDNGAGYAEIDPTKSYYQCIQWYDGICNPKDVFYYKDKGKGWSIVPREIKQQFKNVTTCFPPEDNNRYKRVDGFFQCSDKIKEVEGTETEVAQNCTADASCLGFDYNPNVSKGNLCKQPQYPGADSPLLKHSKICERKKHSTLRKPVFSSPSSKCSGDKMIEIDNGDVIYVSGDSGEYTTCEYGGVHKTRNCPQGLIFNTKLEKDPLETIACVADSNSGSNGGGQSKKGPDGYTVWTQWSTCTTSQKTTRSRNCNNCTAYPNGENEVQTAKCGSNLDNTKLTTLLLVLATAFFGIAVIIVAVPFCMGLNAKKYIVIAAILSSLAALFAISGWGMAKLVDLTEDEKVCTREKSWSSFMPIIGFVITLVAIALSVIAYSFENQKFSLEKKITDMENVKANVKI